MLVESVSKWPWNECPSQRGLGVQVRMESPSEATEPGRHAVVVMDGAGWHTIDTASPFTNVSLLKLPPYSPELNPMEQVWQWLRQRCLSNRVFRGYEEIVEQVSRAWNTFIADVERVKNLCWREWIKLVN